MKTPRRLGVIVLLLFPITGAGELSQAQKQKLEHEKVRMSQVCGKELRSPSKPLAAPGGGSAEDLFFLHEPVSFAPVIQCLEGAILSRGARHFDDILEPEHAGALADYHLYPQWSVHKRRTTDLSKAKLHVLNAPIFASYVATSNFPECRNAGNKTHFQRVVAVTNAIEEILASVPSDAYILFVYAYWSVWQIGRRSHGFDPIWGSTDRFVDLRQAIARHADRFVIATTDMDYRAGFKADFAFHECARLNHGMKNNPFSSKTLRAVVLPYVANGWLEHQAHLRISTCDVELSKATRNISVIFHGSASRRGKGGFRSVVVQGVKRRIGDSADVQDNSVQTMERQMALSATKMTAKSMLKSRFCLSPEGDTLTSRRPYDALAAGCIPILFGTKLGDLPFWDTGYTKIFVIAGGLQCCASHQETFNEWIAEVIQDYDASLSCLATAIFRETLSYRNGAVVDNLVDVLASPFQHRWIRLVKPMDSPQNQTKIGPDLSPGEKEPKLCAISAYMFFSSAMRPKLKKDGDSIGDVAKKIGVEWRKLSAKEKAPYQKQADADKVFAQKERATYP
jgi:hypothetical protein